MPEQKKDSLSARSNRKRKSEALDNFPVNEKEISKSDLKIFLDFAIDILDKQYRSYVWNDGKVQSLVTIDTALIAGILVILQTFQHVNIAAFLLLAGAFLALIASFIVCLWHSIPRVNSGIGNEANPRSMIGIVRLDKNEYLATIMGLDLRNMVRMTCWQISGMARNNLRSHNLIKHGVILTIIGVMAISIAVPIIAIADRANINTQVTQLTSLSPISLTSLSTPLPSQRPPTPLVSPPPPTQVSLTPSPSITSTISIPRSGTP